MLKTEDIENNAFVHADLARYCMEHDDLTGAAMYLGRYFAETEILGVDHDYVALSDILFEQMIDSADKAYFELVKRIQLTERDRDR